MSLASLSDCRIICRQYCSLTNLDDGTGQMRSVKSLQAAEESDVRYRQYCTQACLLGLVRKRPLDDACPNVRAHRAHGDHRLYVGL